MACSSGTDAARSYPHKPQHRFVRRAGTKVQERAKMQARAQRGNNNQAPVSRKSRNLSGAFRETQICFYLTKWSLGTKLCSYF